MNHAKLNQNRQEMIESLGIALQEVHPEMGKMFSDENILECSIPALASFLLPDNKDSLQECITMGFSLVLTMPEVYQIMRPVFYETIYKHLISDDVKTEEYAQFVAMSSCIMAMNGMNDKSAFRISLLTVHADSKIKAE